MKAVAAVFLEGNSLFLNPNLLQHEFGLLERIRNYFKPREEAFLQSLFFCQFATRMASSPAL